MNNSIEILKNLIKKHFPGSSLTHKLESDNTYAENLLFNLLKNGINQVNEDLSSIDFTEKISIDFLSELLFDLANSLEDNQDKFIQLLLNEKHNDFINQIEDIKLSKLALKKIERQNLKNRFNTIENQELNISDADIEKTIQLNNRKQLKNHFKELDKSKSKKTTKVIKLNSFLKYAAILILIPISVIAIYLTFEKQETRLASNKKTNQSLLKKKTSQKDSSDLELKLDLNSVKIPNANTEVIEIIPFKEESYGYAGNSKGIYNTNLNIINIGLQIEEIKKIWGDKLVEHSNKKEINDHFGNLVDSISNLNFNYLFDKKDNNLTIYSKITLNQTDINIYNTYETFSFLVIKLKNNYYKLEYTKKPRPLSEIKDLDLIEYCIELE